MLDTVMPSPFENVQECGEIGTSVGMGMIDGVSNTCLSGQVDDALRLSPRKEIQGVVGVREIEIEMFVILVRRYARESGAFESHIVVVVDLVDTDDVVATVEQCLCDGRADETRGSGH